MRIITSGKNPAEPRFEITVKDGYGEAYLALVARNNPGVCRYRRGKLRMTPRAFLVFSQGLAGAQKAVAQAHAKMSGAVMTPRARPPLVKARAPRLDAKPIDGDGWWVP